MTASLCWLSEVFSTVSAPAHPMTALPNSIATPKDNAAVFNRLVMVQNSLLRFGLAAVRLSGRMAERESVSEDPITMRRGACGENMMDIAADAMRHRLG